MSRRLSADQRCVLAKLATLPARQGLIVDECGPDAEAMQSLTVLGLAETKRGEWDKIMGRITPRGRLSVAKTRATRNPR